VSFAQPLFLFALLVVPAAVAAWWWTEGRRVRYAFRFTNLDVLALVAGSRPWRRLIPPLLFLLTLCLASVALSRPYLPGLVPLKRATVILVVDTSGSMQATDVKPSRLGAAKAAARAFLARTPAQLRVGLIALNQTPQVASPATTDHALVREAIDTLSSGGETAIGDAIAAAVQLGRHALTATANAPTAANTVDPNDLGELVSILLLSDGAQTNGSLQPLQGAQLAKSAGVRVYTNALGTPTGAITRGDPPFAVAVPVPPDPPTLRAIAHLTGGEFTNATNATILKHTYTRLGDRLGRAPGRNEITYALLATAALLLTTAVLVTLSTPYLP
jgi:Ca-activated chloride channel family protein